MGLDARVYCDCLEKGLLRKPLPSGATVKAHDDGYPMVMLNGKKINEDHPDFGAFACVHEHRWLTSHRLGNVSLVGLLRAELSRHATMFPLILGKVVYSGSHGGDWIGPRDIPALKIELERLREFKCVGNVPIALLPRLFWQRLHIGRHHYTSAAEADRFMVEFRQSLTQLADAALSVGKPIVF